ncbi:phosphotransferase family protein [Streptosporangium pseudovulgare]|uniref:Aminoglycoside phosphotransferase n=1 Tax=Streptosporangium pseudovulgare TaxID=35765 RepID=A0ABQ2QNM3_9ACTN|nr:phosphotransferase [Streptosporangium pseudovulgare]GGP86488.1 aminoglycoside phosphotransferase [Streptosporangium pseudovulgare]
MTIAAEGSLLPRVTGALTRSCRQAGLDATGFRMGHDAAGLVCHLAAEGVVVRLAREDTPDEAERPAVSVRVARWLADRGFPADRPLDVEQPIVAEGFLATFWRRQEHIGPPPDPAQLGPLLRRLHALPPVPFELPACDPLGAVRRAAGECPVLDHEDRGWLLGRCDVLAEAYGLVEFALPYGLVHGDARRENMIRTPRGFLLRSWQWACAGPREIDLVPTLHGARFGLTERQLANFSEAYGHDARSQAGYPVLRDIRDLQTLTALLRRAHLDAGVRDELRHRLGSLRAGDDRLWHLP